MYPCTVPEYPAVAGREVDAKRDEGKNGPALYWTQPMRLGWPGLACECLPGARAPAVLGALD